MTLAAWTRYWSPASGVGFIGGRRPCALPHYDRHLTLRLARRLHRDLDILSERGQEFHQPSNREIPGAIAHQCGDVRLLDAEDFARLRLSQVTRLHNLVDLQCQAGL